MSVLDTVDLAVTLDRKAYVRELRVKQLQLRLLAMRNWRIDVAMPGHTVDKRIYAETRTLLLRSRPRRRHWALVSSRHGFFCCGAQSGHSLWRRRARFPNSRLALGFRSRPGFFAVRIERGDCRLIRGSRQVIACVGLRVEDIFRHIFRRHPFSVEFLEKHRFSRSGFRSLGDLCLDPRFHLSAGRRNVFRRTQGL